MEERYKKILENGIPQHAPFDDFSIKHPSMDLSRRAKIFNPFDALKGFDEEIASTALTFKTHDLEHVSAEDYP